MAKRRYRRRARRYYARFRRRIKDKKVPLLVAVPSLAPLGISAYEQKDRFTSDPMGALIETGLSSVVRYTGFNPRDGQFYWNYPMQTYSGIIVGSLAHKLMSKLGVNRAMAKVPMIGKYIAL